MRGAVAAAFAVFVLAGAAAAQDECRLTLAASLPISPENVRRVIIPAELDGKPVNLAIDTGSPFTALTHRAVDRLGLETRLITARLRINFPYGGGRVTHYAPVRNFKLGQMTAGRARFIVMPGDMNEADGLLGVDFLGRFDVDFDFAGGKVNLFLPHPCAGKAVYWTHSAPLAVIPFEGGESGGKIRIEVALDGRRMPATVDTGAPNTSISLTTATSWFHIDENTPGVRDLRDGAFRYRFKTLSLDGITVQNPDMLIHAKAKGGHTIDFQALLGMNVLRQLHLFVSYKEKAVYATAAAAH